MNNAFGVELWRRVPAGNYVVSPASIATALAMTWTGARGKTADEMRRVLHLDGDVDEVARAWGALASELRSPSLAIANRLFGDRSYAFEAAFQARLAASFGAPTEPVDFQHEAESARARINAWVAEQTKQKIQNLLGPGSVDAMTRLVLVNAIYFLGKWLAPFEKYRTRDREFWTSASTSKLVPTMHRRGAYRIGTITGGEIIELPYEGNSIAMYVAMPDARDGLASIERSLDFTSWTARLDETELDLALPRFEVAPPTLAVKPILEAMGMPLAFDASRADFTAMSNPPDPRDGLFLAAVYHKAYVKTDEEGTVAAAATAAVMALRGRPQQVKQFIVDRPFLFFIADTRTNTVLFVGRVVEPA